MKKNFKKYCSILLAAILLPLTLLYPVSAAGTGVTAPEDKIDPALQEKLDEMNQDDTIDVSVWLKDIDYQQVADDVTDELETMHQSGKLSAQALLLPQDDLTAMRQSAQNNAASAYSAESVQGLDPSQVTAEDAQEFIETKREVTAQKYGEQNTQIFNSLFPKEKQGIIFRTVQQEQPKIIYSCKYAPNVMMTLTKSQVETVARSADVEELYYYNNVVKPEDIMEEEPITVEASPQTVAASNISLSYQSSTGVANMRIYNHADGTGIKLGQIELGAPKAESRVFDHMRNTQDPLKDKIHVLLNKCIDEGLNNHALAVATLMVGKTAEFTSIVPNAELYCVGAMDSHGNQNWKEGTELLLEAGVNVINASYQFTGESTTGIYGESCKWLEHVVYAHNVTLCISSGNDTSVLKGAMAHNVITVGNINDKHTTSLSDDERMVNPKEPTKQSAYSTNATLAYKPDIMAPGATAGSPVDPQNGSSDHGGTSYSAPIVSGAAVQLCCMYSYYRTKPALIKAALLAGAIKTQEMKNYDSDSDPNNDIDSVTGSWRPALDRMNGAGMLSVTTSAALLYDSCYSYFPNFGGTNNPFTIPLDVTEYSRMQICLSWLKKNTITGQHQTGTVDEEDKATFILEVLDPQGELLYNSWYRYDTKEYIAFEPTVLGEYTIRVRKTNLLNTGTDFALCWYQL